jgi:hypothetical protein
LNQPPDTEYYTTRQLVDIIYRHAGQPRGKLRAMPGLLLNVLGLVNPTMRELVEMQYQFEEPFIVDSSKITTRLGCHATPTDHAVADTLDTYLPGTSPTTSTTRS